MKRYYIQEEGDKEPVGPLTKEEINRMLFSGAISDNTLCWDQPANKWIPAGTINAPAREPTNGTTQVNDRHPIVMFLFVTGWILLVAGFITPNLISFNPTAELRITCFLAGFFSFVSMSWMAVCVDMLGNILAAVKERKSNTKA